MEESEFDVEKVSSEWAPLVIVIKIGSSSVVETGTRRVAIPTLTLLAEVICKLMSHGHKVILVSSGAVGLGQIQLGLSTKPTERSKKQALAAVGQGRLLRIYEDLFSYFQRPIGQVLITRGDLHDKAHYLRAQRAVLEMLSMGILPIFNENDTLAAEDVNFEDNDTLSALIAAMVNADWLFLMTDVDALYTSNPFQNPEARPVHRVASFHDISSFVSISEGSGSSWGTGGMSTKVRAAKLACATGCNTVVTLARKPERIVRIIAGELFGTLFPAFEKPIRDKKRWFSHGLAASGCVIIDDGASRAVLGGSSLFAVGIVEVRGQFAAETAVSVLDVRGNEVAKGLVNFSSDDLNLIRGQNSKKVSEILSLPEVSGEVMNRRNLAIFSNQNSNSL